MTQLSFNRTARRGRIFPEHNIPPQELARRKAEREVRYQQSCVVFERARPELIQEHYNWYIIIESNSGDYFIDASEEVAEQKARQNHPDAWLVTFRLNETGACGKI